MADPSKEEKELEALEDLKAEKEEDLEELERAKKEELKDIESKIAKLKKSIAKQKEGETIEEFQRRQREEQEEVAQLESQLRHHREEADVTTPRESLEDTLQDVPAAQQAQQQAYQSTVAQPQGAYHTATRTADDLRRDLYDVAAEATLDRLRDLNYNRGNWNQRDVEDYNRIKYEVHTVQEMMGDEKANMYFRGVGEDIFSAFDETRKMLHDMGYKR